MADPMLKDAYRRCATDMGHGQFSWLNQAKPGVFASTVFCFVCSACGARAHGPTSQPIAGWEIDPVEGPLCPDCLHSRALAPATNCPGDLDTRTVADVQNDERRGTPCPESLFNRFWHTSTPPPQLCRLQKQGQWLFGVAHDGELIELSLEQMRGLIGNALRVIDRTIADLALSPDEASGDGVSGE